MYNANKWLTLSLLLLLIPKVSFGIDQPPFVCGLSNGYPPYQFKSIEGETLGIDAQLLTLIFNQADLQVTFVQDDWVNILSFLSFTKQLDCVGGMEVTKERQERFDFTSPIYFRKIAIFTLENNSSVNSLTDLMGKKLSGDMHSSIEQKLKHENLRQQIRVVHSLTKSDAMKRLISGEVDAMIAPLAVGQYLAKVNGVKIKIILTSDYLSPVAIAVKKGNTQLLNQLERSIQTLKDNNKIELIKQQWL
ncbi:substrate-binding periplasmic protein [Thalassotalea piscium]|uniref:ABC-type amino acid transport substrate-binding protein n=1 Tax=Thalassotalea piscium TaxID=1230533 RepID=A0A7X0TSY4_9GAMM|nr:transporter substrate-binding domain-containing protein [Thalassotalea piscium]MBB6542623.1 ABC-type amino acid transport substrate-binding protein [Thalassotalea piscium]